MITNNESMPRKFKCKKILANYLLYQKKLPLLSVDGEYYYFLDNESTKDILRNLPIWLRLLRWVE